MAKKYNKTTFDLPHNSMIEVVATKGEKFSKVEMTYGEALKINKKRGWIYKFYQLGFSQFKKTK